LAQHKNQRYGRGQKNGSDALFEKLLLTKAASSQNLDGKELIAFAAELKTLFQQPQPQTDNFLERYAKLEELKERAVSKFSELQEKARQSIHHQETKSLTRELIEEGMKAAKTMIQTTLAKPNIPVPTSIPEPLAISQNPEQIEALTLPEPLPTTAALAPAQAPAYYIQPQVQSATSTSPPDQIGYTNLSSPYREVKTKQ